MAYDCEHQFTRASRPRYLRDRRGWLFGRRRRWVCVLCGLSTRHYDGIDGSMCRPVHRHMSVAFRGYNTVPDCRG